MKLSRTLELALAPALLMLWAAAPFRAAEPLVVHTPDGARPEILDALGALDGLLALATSADGRQAAVALDPGSADRDARTTLKLHRAGEEPTVLAVPGRIRDLLFSRDGGLVFALQHKPAKHGDGETFLMRIDIETLQARQGLRLPPSARALDHSVDSNSLLVACRDEIRTVLLPELRSGPLFRVIGNNLSLTALGGGSRILVGQPEQLLLLDLTDPSGRLEMPARERVPSPAPVVSLAAAADGSTALARLGDGRVFRVELEPLALTEAGAEGALVRVAAIAPRATPPRPAVVPPSPAATNVEMQPPEAVVGIREPDPAEPAPGQPAAGEPVPVPEPVATLLPDEGIEMELLLERGTEELAKEADPMATPPADGPPASLPAEPPLAPDAGAELGEPPFPDGAQLAGRITGPAAARVVAVVAYGPDNILREAARVRPEADGRWALGGLEPGRYRIRLDAGGGRVLVSEPAFLVVDLATSPVRAPDLRALRVL